MFLDLYANSTFHWKKVWVVGLFGCQYRLQLSSPYIKNKIISNTFCRLRLNFMHFPQRNKYKFKNPSGIHSHTHKQG